MIMFTQSELTTHGDPEPAPLWTPAPSLLPQRFTDISVPDVQPSQLAEKLMDVIAPVCVEMDFATAG